MQKGKSKLVGTTVESRLTSIILCITLLLKGSLGEYIRAEDTQCWNSIQRQF
jgi:hypothetical protein